MKVLIVGAGPSGLMMANCLKQYGVGFTIIDSKDKTTEFSKALGMHARSLEVFEELGLAQRMVDSGIVMKLITFYKGAKLLASVDFSILESQFPYTLGIPQSETERILSENLSQNGVNVLWQTTLVDFEENDQGVFCTLEKEGKTRSELFDFVIGCDGIHSKVRETLAIPFIGMKNPENFAVADVDVDGEIDLENISAFIATDDNGIVLIFPLSKNRARFVINNCLLDKHEVPTLDYIQTIINQRMSRKILLKNLHWASVFNVQYRKAALFSKGRCFLVGDAAHVHSPIGGQGMNTGLQDAFNLAWKLAYVIKHKLDPKLLHTYHEERHLNAKRLLSLTHKMTIVGTARSRLMKFLRPRIIKLLLNRNKIQNFLVNRLSQLSLHYQESSLSQEVGFGYLFKQGSIRAGDRFPNFKVKDTIDAEQKFIHPFLKGSQFTLVVFVKNLEESLKEIQRLDFLINGKYLDFKYILISTHQVQKVSGFSGVCLKCLDSDMERFGKGSSFALVIRPDKYIGLKTEKLDAKVVEKYLDQKFFA